MRITKNIVHTPSGLSAFFAFDVWSLVYFAIGYVTLAAITGPDIPVTYLWAKSHLQEMQIYGSQIFNSLAPRGFGYSLKLVNFKLISKIHSLSIFCEIGIRWMPQHLPDH